MTAIGPSPPRPCRHCGSATTTRTTAKPPRKHNGPCTPECTRPAILCLNCRMLDTN
ncbi:hypothetical protein OG497_37820 [Streptomyces sp. NBC_01242]|uniref:hypothetical protein n=1 Tax=Streptomyces sp. NBC_01242 TaxID=2903795 RepID=UPI002257660E|nr:hypothetical protein [Streptomyces sp. NBC_01242]MCX4799617.1 hypothetical protein [Streptomyces sp. NBC_01242]